MAYTNSPDLVDLLYKRKIEEVYQTIKAQIASISSLLKGLHEAKMYPIR